MIFAVLAEDHSDAEALAAIIRRIIGGNNVRVLRKGFRGCGSLCNKAGRHIENFAEQGATHFIICHDSDGKESDFIQRKVLEAINQKIVLKQYQHRIIVPIQELEAWLIADEDAIRTAIPSLSIPPQQTPERIPNPKEWLVKESGRGQGSRPLYAPKVFNAQVAEHLNIEKLNSKCPSFKELFDYIQLVRLKDT